MSSRNAIEMDRDNRVQSSGNSIVIEIPPTLSVVEAPVFRSAITPLCETEPGCSALTLDFSKTTFIDSSGIGALASIIKMAKIAGISLQASGVTLEVASVLKMTGLNHLLNIKVSMQEKRKSTHNSGVSSTPPYCALN